MILQTLNPETYFLQLYYERQSLL